MSEVLGIVALVSVAAATSAAARRVGLLAPILLLAVGVGVSFLPGKPSVELDPELVLFGILPPLLYVTANRTSVPAFRANLRPILLLAVGLVVATVVVVGLVLHAVLPDMPLAAAFALGAVVAPPDAIAATAVARRVGLPRRLVTVLEGESLLNDATALVILRFTVGAMIGEAVDATEVATDVVLAVGGGVGVGVATAWAAAQLHRRTTDRLLHNTLSLLTPFVAYAAAEYIEGSGVIAVVICGLYLGHRWTVLVSAESRLQMGAFWRMVEFLLESTVFLLVGLQLRSIVHDLHLPASDVAAATAAVVLTVIAVRFLWVYPAVYLARLVPRIRARDPSPARSIPAVLSWAGMRGIITLAAALTLPLVDADGSPLPYHALLVWLAFAVIVATLVVQGMTLAPMARWVHIPRDDARQDTLTFAAVQSEAVRAGLARLDAVAGDAPVEVVDQLRTQAERRANLAWEKLGPSPIETPAAAYKRLRKEMLAAERAVINQARDDGRIPEETMNQAQRFLDLEESMLRAYHQPVL